MVRALAEKPGEKDTTDTDGKGHAKQEGLGSCTRGCREIPDNRLAIGLGVQKGVSGGKGQEARIADRWAFKSEA